MTATFLVTVDVPSTDLLGEAEDIQHALESSGIDVLTVHPWARQDVEVPTVIPTPQQPT